MKKILLLPFFIVPSLRAMEIEQNSMEMEPAGNVVIDFSLPNDKPSRVPSLQSLAAKSYAAHHKHVPTDIPSELQKLIKLNQAPNKAMMWEQLEYADKMHNKKKIDECTKYITKELLPWKAHLLILDSDSDYDNTLSNIQPDLTEKLHTKILDGLRERRISLNFSLLATYLAVPMLSGLGVFIFFAIHNGWLA